jgi:D-3-phosphoglycerate dehydrogenase
MMGSRLSWRRFRGSEINAMQNAKVAILTEKPFSSAVRDRMVALMRDGGLEVIVIEGKDAKDNVAGRLAGVAGVIVRSDVLDAPLLSACPGLQLVVRAGAGYETIDVAHAEKSGIVVENTPGQNANAVAELALALMLASVRPLDGGTGAELRGKILGVHGFGYIGRLVSRLGAAFGMKVKACDVRMNTDVAAEYQVAVADSPEALYDGADLVSLHIPDNADTHGVVTRDLLMRMSPAGVLVNTARPGVVNEPDLLAVLDERKGFRYASDVAPSGPVLKVLSEKFADRIVITPGKQGAQTVEANTNAGMAAARQALSFFRDGDTTFCVYKVIPPALKDYSQLAVQLGRLDAAYVPRPRRVLVSAYGELNGYRSALAEYVLKGILTASLSRSITPSMAAEYAAENGIELVEREPDNSKGYGNALTVDLVGSDGASFSSRGRIDEGQMEASRIGEFKARMPLDPGIYVLASYKEGPGMADKVGRFIVEAGFNRVVLGAGPNMDHSMAQVFFQVEKAGLDVDAQLAEMQRLSAAMRSVPDVFDVRVVNLLG